MAFVQQSWTWVSSGWQASKQKHPLLAEKKVTSVPLDLWLYPHSRLPLLAVSMSFPPTKSLSRTLQKIFTRLSGAFEMLFACWLTSPIKV